MDFLKKTMLNEVVKNVSGSKHSSSSSSDPSGHGKKKEDVLDKAIDFVQEHALKQGSQKNESAAEQAKDEKIKKGINSLFKAATGKNFPGTK